MELDWHRFALSGLEFGGKESGVARVRTKTREQGREGKRYISK